MQMASVFVIVYLFVGRKLRSWMPLFVYAHVVTGERLLVHSIIRSALLQARELLFKRSHPCYGAHAYMLMLCGSAQCQSGMLARAVEQLLRKV